MQSRTFHTTHGTVHALQFGRGERLLIALHGFADSARMFLPLENKMGERYTIVAIDLPFHGQTVWDQSFFSPNDLLGIISQILEQERKTRFSVLGFSFGARLVLSMLPTLKPSLENIYLFSPDGIRTRWMTAATLTPLWLRKLLERLLRKPGWLLVLTDVARKWRLLPAFLHHFFHRHLKNPHRIRRVFGCWYALPFFPIERRKIREALQTSDIPTSIVVGSRDPLLNFEQLSDYFDGIPKVRIVQVEGGGHQLFTDASVTF